ncbi:restriction endonuclease subunit S [Patescibacteria group bacterium]|nr:restriction endonuclease subunit S [Patescibacteria group bacterium]
MTTATKYKTYSQYKPSGADWLGDIPDNWEAKRLRYFFDYHAGGVWGDEEKGDQNDLICLRVADFDFDHFGLSDNDLTTRNIPENQHSRILEKGDILLEKSGGGEKQTVGRAVRFDSNNRAVCSNFIEKLTPLKVHNSKYISYLMGALYFGTINVRSIKQTTGIQNLDIYAYFSEVVPFPEKAIQKSIADFLDRETTKIDEMVAKKQKMMELLKEKRQALITHAVTKGLDPKAKMKPSGIEWLGDIPEGWEVKKAKFLSDFVSGYSFDSESYVDDGVPIIRIGDIAEIIDFEGVKKVPTELSIGLEKFNVKSGDILLALTGATIGKTAIYNSTEVALLNQRVAILRGKKLDQKYLTYFIASSIFKENIDYLCFGGAQENIGKSEIGSIIISYPKIDEQKEIVAYLDRETAKIDEMMKKVEKQIEKLQEYRQALITNAVTGKIKIKNYE